MTSLRLAAARPAAGRIALLALGLLFAGLWTHGLADAALTGDEAFIAEAARQGPAEVLKRLNSDEPHPPVYYLGMVGWGRLFPKEHELLWRLPSVLMGLVALSLVFRLGRELGLGVWAAAGAAALLAINPQVSVHVREARMYLPMMVTVSLAALAAVRAARGRGSAAAAGLASLLALLTHYFNAPFVAALGVWGLLSLRGRDRRLWLLAQGLAWLVLVVWLVFFGQGFFNPASLSAGKSWSFLLPPWETLARIAAVGAAGYRAYGENALTYIAAPLLTLAWLEGARQSGRRSNWFLLILVLGPLAAYAGLAAVRPVFHPKYVLPWLVFASVGAGQTLASGRRAGLVLGLAAALAMSIPAWDTLTRPYEASLNVSAGERLTSLPRDLGRALQALSGPEDLFGLTTPDPAHCYYAVRYFGRSLGCALLPAYPGQPADELAGQVDGLLAKHRLLWLLEFSNPAWDPAGAAQAVLRQRAVSLGQAQVAGRSLDLFAGPATVAARQTPVGGRLGDYAELTGAWVVPAQGLRVLVVWRSLADQPAVSAKVFVHLQGADGVMLAQDDGVPVAWTRPFDTWRQGEVLYDLHVLTLPEGMDLAGAKLLVGAYNPDTLMREPAFQGGSRTAEDALVVPMTPARAAP